MTFANPLWLLLLLLAVPIALLHNRNRRTVRVPSVHLWRRIVQETPPRPAWKPPRPNRLLALQLLALASIAFALARPHLRESATDHWIIVLDASAEMQAPEGWATAFEAAAARLRRRLEGEPAATRISLIRTGGETRLLAARYQRPDDVALALDEATATHAAADWEEAAALLPGLSRDGESTRITVLAGPAGAGDAVAAFRRVLPDAAVEAATFGQPVS
ncbi:MAG TPA: BatA domain-containing protein, partial [Longimicrobiales bacterium]|nr:BatA domain-containing protein [Longimicrobiales bacterium]